MSKSCLRSVMLSRIKLTKPARNRWTKADSADCCTSSIPGQPRRRRSCGNPAVAQFNGVLDVGVAALLDGLGCPRFPCRLSATSAFDTPSTKSHCIMSPTAPVPMTPTHLPSSETRPSKRTRALESWPLHGPMAETLVGVCRRLVFANCPAVSIASDARHLRSMPATCERTMT